MQQRAVKGNPVYTVHVAVRLHAGMCMVIVWVYWHTHTHALVHRSVHYNGVDYVCITEG